MNISPTTATNNITEILGKIIDFTERRRQILTENILNANSSDFVPRDLDVEGFADLMAQAVSEHMRNKRLLLCDSETIKFGDGGSFESLPVIDKQGKELFDRNREKYLQSQVDKLSENLINNKIANELLYQLQAKEHTAQHFE